MTTYVYSPLIDCLIETLKHYFTQISSALIVSIEYFKVFILALSFSFYAVDTCCIWG